MGSMVRTEHPTTKQTITDKAGRINNALFGEFCVLCGGFISTHKKSGTIAAFVASQSQNYFSL